MNRSRNRKAKTHERNERKEKLEKLKEKIEIKIGTIVIYTRGDIGLIEEREAEIKKTS